MYFPQEVLLQLEKEYLTVSGKYAGLLDAYVFRTYNNPRAREHAHHGFSRRLKTLVQCIDNIFKTLPPDRVDQLTNEEQSDANINLQAFVFNAFGSVENLAWIWVYEKGVTKEDGKPIPNKFVGLRPNNVLVRKSFSPKFQAYLNELGGWFGNLDAFRHAVAHRIPLYVPPYVITQDKEAAYKDLENRKSDALNRRAFDDYDRLSAEQDALGVFQPIMTHSFEERADCVVFHAQMLADFNTIEVLGRKMLGELDR